VLQFTILGSGSSGNCAYLETDDARVLVDAGFSGKQIDERLQKIGRSIRDVQAVFVTHEHSDHVAGLPVLARRLGVPVYCNRLTAEALRPQMPDYTGWRIFETGQSMPFGDLEITSFQVPHDAYDPVGFVFHHKSGDIGFLTDLGYATKLVLERIRQTRALVLEANHDLRLLQEDVKRPWSVKQRILSRHGHLSNEAAAQVAAQVVGFGMEDIFLGHLSADCNRPDLALAAVRAGLNGKAARVRLHETSPVQHSQTLCWN
jgi:phosphoribosyl 1,2-cyclic phosphodiesterase